MRRKLAKTNSQKAAEQAERAFNAALKAKVTAGDRHDQPSASIERDEDEIEEEESDEEEAGSEEDGGDDAEDSPSDSGSEGKASQSPEVPSKAVIDQGANTEDEESAQEQPDITTEITSQQDVEAKSDRDGNSACAYVVRFSQLMVAVILPCRILGGRVSHQCQTSRGVAQGHANPLQRWTRQICDVARAS